MNRNSKNHIVQYEYERSKYMYKLLFLEKFQI